MDVSRRELGRRLRRAGAFEVARRGDAHAIHLTDWLRGERVHRGARRRRGAPHQDWSPQRISGWLKDRFGNDDTMK